MNLIKQLQATSKWKEFEEWYNEKFYTYGNIPFEGWYCGGDPQCGFVDLNINLQKGVFEKFISKDATDITVDGYLGKETYSLILNKSEWKWFNSFEELLIWYFNN